MGMQITLTGDTPKELKAEAQALIALLGGAKPAGKKAADAVEDDDAADTDLDASDDDADTDLDADDEPTPSKKAAKLTVEDMREAAQAHAEENGKKATLEILKKKFKVNAPTELKKDQFLAFLKAVKV